ncbi:MAG TPA: hypothetical protein VEL76_12275 [Gemmataceae bacterium]|nr:hypothetical protein [Gemmataceae bacterium]
MDRKRLIRGAGRTGALVALLSCLVVNGRAAPGGTPAGQIQVDGKIYTNQPVFNLPIKLDPQSRALVRDVSLFVKCNGGQWMRQDTAPPTQAQFRYQAPQDGEYWFSVVTTDKNGVSTPRDVSQEAPALMVVVDTQQPNFDLQPVGLPGGQFALRCTIQDSNPDYQATKIQYRSADQTVRVLEPIPGQVGLFRAPGPEVQSGWVCVTVVDRALNKTTRDLDLREVLARVAPAQPPLPVATAPLPGTPLPTAPQPLPPLAGTTAPTAAARTPPEVIQAGATSPPVHVASKQAALSGSVSAEPGLPTPPTSLPESLSPKTGAQPPVDAKASSLPRQLINTTHAVIKYRIDPVGPSGISKIEIYMSPDKGQTWRRMGEDVDRSSPAEIDLPGEGLYGIRLAVTNGNGFGGKAPAPNDAPTSWVEVDMTCPVVQLRDIDPNATGGTLEIRWVVSDKNLGAEPIKLFYAARREGPWVPIASNLKNDGSYRWAFPRDAGGQFFVRLEATDQAGNVARCETPQPVTLDMTEPNGVVVGISGVNTPGAPQGH